jgi:hypothetical protein
VAGTLALRPYQDDAADFLYARDRAMILAPVGAGKTCITLTAMADAIDAGVVKRWLVVAPKRVCTDVWPVERPKWAPTLTMALAVGTPAQRAAALASDADVVVINYDNLDKLDSLSGFDGIVFDELTRLKNPSGKRFKALEKLLSGITVRWGLTGSFTSNGLEDVFGQCKIVDQALLGRAKGAFLQQYFICINRDFGQWTPAAGALEQVMQRIRPATYVLEPGEYADKLPPCHVVEVRTVLDAREPYEKMKKEYVARFGSDQVIAQNAASVTTKLQQMSCLSEGTPVMTKRGWVPINCVHATDLIWDGVEWVRHGGVVFQGEKPIALCHGVFMTYDHQVLTVAGWQSCEDILNGYESGRFDRADVRLPDGYPQNDYLEWPRRMAMPLRMRGGDRAAEPVPSGRSTETPPKLRLPSRKHGTWYDRQPTVSNMGQHEGSLHQPEGQGLHKLWRAWRRGLPRMAGVIRSVLARHAGWLCGYFDAGSNRQRRPVFTEKLPMGDAISAAQQQTVERMDRRAGGPRHDSAGRADAGNAAPDVKRAAEPIRMVGREGAEHASTYDILNCGPRNRFVVRSAGGRPLIVHNCGFVYDREGPTPVHWFSTHKFDRLEELLAENQRANTIVAYTYQEELAELKRRFPHAQTIDSPGVIDRWNRGDVELLLVHPKSAGHGLNLQHGGCHMVFLSLPWSLELYEQTVGRLHRGGQTRDVWVYVILADKTIDERIWAALHDKRAVSDIALEELKNG